MGLLNQTSSWQPGKLFIWKGINDSDSQYSVQLLYFAKKIKQHVYQDINYRGYFR